VSTEAADAPHPDYTQGFFDHCPGSSPPIGASAHYARGWHAAAEGHAALVALGFGEGEIETAIRLAYVELALGT